MIIKPPWRRGKRRAEATWRRRTLPNAVAPNGQQVRVLGAPFRVSRTGPVWVAAVCSDGRIRPFEAEGMRR